MVSNPDQKHTADHKDHNQIEKFDPYLQPSRPSVAACPLAYLAMVELIIGLDLANRPYPRDIAFRSGCSNAKVSRIRLSCGWIR